VYAVGVIRGTKEQEYSDTTFLFGIQKAVEKKIAEHTEEVSDSGERKAEIVLEQLDSLEEAKSQFMQHYGTYNNFEYQKEEV
jgi:hypothetical protein